MDEKQSKSEENKNLQGNALTKEQLSDVYMAGNSDGIHQLAQGEVKVENEPYKE